MWRAARRLQEGLAGAVVQRVELRWPTLAGADLRGWRTIAVVPRGKHILHRFDSGMTLHSHLRMEGRWEVRTQIGRRPPDHSDVRAWIVTEGAQAVGRRLGMLDLVATEAEDSVVGPLGPDVLGEVWLSDEVRTTLSADRRPIGAALLDQQVVAGLGTMWVSEVLHELRIHPWRPAAELTTVELDQLLDLARRWLWRAKDLGMTSGAGVRRGTGKRVHARSGQHCLRCGDQIRVAMIGTAAYERTMFYCPSCQGGYGPTDDRSPQSPMGPRRRGSVSGPARGRRPRRR